MQEKEENEEVQQFFVQVLVALELCLRATYNKISPSIISKIPHR